jgi:transcriptional regulator with XRE-family HTH domain
LKLLTGNDLDTLLWALAKVTRELRERHRPGASQEELGLDIGMDRSYWGALERGEHEPKLRTLMRMATALRVSPEHLVRVINQNYKLKLR